MAETVGGRYRLQARIGRGGMGVVYRAYDEVQEREIALKRFKLALDRTDEQQRFRREFHTLARLRHPRVVEAYDFGVDEGRPYYTMELLDGQDLRELAPIDWQDACPLLRDVASALAFLHTHGLLHRDVAGRNVRCTSDGRAKLLDFGMLATMGVSTEVVGTLPSIAPEMILGLPMDGRADLFGLGALAFWLLTGRHPQRLRSLDDLLRNGRRPPPRPSSLVAEIPAELDELILALLSPEPLARPGAAAEVIERLGAIGGLAPAPELEVARGYAHSAALVGRQREMTTVRNHLREALAARGATLMIEGDTGNGKTRLLREIELEAKLAGSVVVRATGDADGPYAVVRELAEKLVSHSPDSLETPGSTRVNRILSPLQSHDSTAEAAVVRSRIDHREERLAMQTALTGWLAAFTDDGLVVIIIDDIQRADEGSAAVLASLAYAAHDHRLLLCVARRTDEQTRATTAVAKLREQATVVRARGLGQQDVEDLLRTVFGNADGLTRLAVAMHKLAGGRPLHCIELIRHLMDRGLARYVGGMWVIPETLDEEHMPRRLEQAMDARVEALGPTATLLGQALAVHGSELSLRQCVTLSGAAEESDAFSAIDELVDRGIVTGSTDRFALAHEGLREALLRSLKPARRRELELRVGQMLAAEGTPGPELEARIGWHLLRGGEERAGAELLERAGRNLFDATSFEDAVPLLEAALDVHRRHGASPRVVCELYAMLIPAGFYCDREVVRRHADEGIRTLAHYGGLALVVAARRVLGAKLGLAVGVALAYIRYWSWGAARGWPNPVEALRKYTRCVAFTAGTAGFSFDTGALREAVERIRPFAGIGRAELELGVTFIGNLLNFNVGRVGTLMRSSDRSLAQWTRRPEGVTANEQVMGIGGARFQRALVAIRSGSPDALQEVDALQQLGTRLWDIGAKQLRTYYHMWRGEEAAARRIRGEVEIEFVRLGSLWQMDAIHNPTSSLIYANTGNMLGLKRAIEALGRQIDAGMCYQSHRAVAVAEYHRLRGDHTEALQHIETALQGLPEGEGLARPWALTARADTLLDAGHYDDALEAARVALAMADDPEYGQVPFLYRAVRTLALAEAHTGRRQAAVKRLDDALSDAQRLRNPYLVGMLHEARAEIALLDEDLATASEHIGEVDQAFTPTANPVLIARLERLRRRSHPETEEPAGEEGEDLVTEILGAGSVDPETLADMLTVLSDCHTATARAQRALELVLTTAGADHGYLLLARNGRLEVAAPTDGDDPPPSVVERTRGLVEEAQAPSKERRPSARFVADEDGSAWIYRLLIHREGGLEVVLGAIVMQQPEDTLPAAPPALVEAVGRRLFEAGDAGLTPIAAHRP